jgi:hypothetical protein
MPGLRFAETMSGTLEPIDDPGQRHPFRFDVKVRARSLLRHLRDGRAALDGTVHAPPIAERAPLTGEITIRPIGAKLIRYEFEFSGDDGKRYAFAGQKDIEYSDLIRTWTTLPGEIRDADGRVVATCETRFDLRGDGLRFFASFRPW